MPHPLYSRMKSTNRTYLTIIISLITWPTMLLIAAQIMGITLPEPFDAISHKFFVGLNSFFELPLVPIGMFLAVFVISQFAVKIAGERIGWMDLHAVFPAAKAHGKPKRKVRFSGMMKGQTFANMYHIGASSEGLFLSTPLVARFGHPPIFIPWKKVSFSEPHHIVDHRNALTALIKLKYVDVIIEDAPELDLHIWAPHFEGFRRKSGSLIRPDVFVTPTPSG